MEGQRMDRFTYGPILSKLILFSLPILAALLLQVMYGAVDLLIVGRFASPADVSAVATGSGLMTMFTNPLTGLAMGVTILIGQLIGEREAERCGAVVGNGIALFGLIGLIISAIMIVFAGTFAAMMQSPAEAFEKTTAYVRICGGGILVIIFYNLIGSIFRGMGDSRTPLVTVAIACVFNIFGDLFLVGVCGMGAAGAAWATVSAQGLSVVLSLILISKKDLPFVLRWKMIRLDRQVSGKIIGFGLPLAASDFLVTMSFLILQAIVNSIGVIPSAGIGVAQKVCGFIMLVPSSFMQSMAAFTAQNVGAGKRSRAFKALCCGIAASIIAGILMFAAAFFEGELLCGIFSGDAAVIAAGTEYLKAYAIDCLFTAIFFVFVGYYNGLGMTRFVMLQGILSAFCVRIPFAYLMSRMEPVSLFRIGLAIPCSTVFQIALCLGCLAYIRKKGMLADRAVSHGD